MCDAVSTYHITDGSVTWAVAGLLGQGLFLIVIYGIVAGVCGFFVLDFLGFEQLVSPGFGWFAGRNSLAD